MIYLKEALLEIPSYKKTFNPNEKNEVDIKTFCDLWNCDKDKAIEVVKNHSDFIYVAESSNDGNQVSQKDGGKITK